MSSILFLPPERIRIPFRVVVRHASAERRMSDSIVVTARRGTEEGLGEGCPRPYVTGETAEGALAWLARVLPDLSSAADDLNTLRRFAGEMKSDIDGNPSAWCAAEIAVLDLLARERGMSVESLLDLDNEPREFLYSAVLSKERSITLAVLGGRYLIAGMKDFKLRPSGDTVIDCRRIDFLQNMAKAARLSPLRIRMDGNNAWAGRFDDCARYLEVVGGKLAALEEPLAPRAYAELARLSARFDLPMVLDESARTPADLSRAADHGRTWIVNLKVSKAGGILRSLDMVRSVRELGWPLCIGAHVGETSVLTRAALVVARAAGDGLTAQEGAFGTKLLERDLATPSLRFGAGGILRWPRESSAHGLGLQRAAVIGRSRK